MAHRPAVLTRVAAPLAACLVLALAGLATVATAATSPTWTAPVAIHGLTDNESDSTGVFVNAIDLACPAPKSCSVAGTLVQQTAGLGAHPFHVAQLAGGWHAAGIDEGFPGLTGGFQALSCPSSGNCSAVGSVGTGGFGTAPLAIVANEVRGTWRGGSSIFTPEVDGPTGGSLSSVSCWAAGSCEAAGSYYVGGAGASGPMVALEVGGGWQDGRALTIPSSLDPEGSQLVSVSCASRGNCTAVGKASGSTGTTVAIEADEVHGTWRQVAAVPGAATLGPLGSSLDVVRCTGAGDCVAAGEADRTDPHGRFASVPTGVVATESHGIWGPLTALPGLVALGTETSSIADLECPAASACQAIGSWSAPGRSGQYVTREVAGRWQPVRTPPGLAAVGPQASLDQLSCASASSCVATGEYLAYGNQQSLYLLERDGTWQPARRLFFEPAVKPHTESVVLALSCAKTGWCAALSYVTIGVIAQVRAVTLLP